MNRNDFYILLKFIFMFRVYIFKFKSGLVVGYEQWVFIVQLRYDYIDLNVWEMKLKFEFG